MDMVSICLSDLCIRIHCIVQGFALRSRTAIKLFSHICERKVASKSGELQDLTLQQFASEIDKNHIDTPVLIWENSAITGVRLMRTFRLDHDEMAVFASRVIGYAENPGYLLNCDLGNARSFNGKVSQLVIVTVQQKPSSHGLRSATPTFHFRFKIDHLGDRISMNWDKVETTVYHLEGRTGMLAGELDDSLKEFLSSHILAAIQRPTHTTVMRRTAEMS